MTQVLEGAQKVGGLPPGEWRLSALPGGGGQIAVDVSGQSPPLYIDTRGKVSGIARPGLRMDPDGAKR